MKKHESKHQSNNEARMPSSGTPVTSADDPRLTAYALEELAGSDVAAVESFLATSPEGRGLVEETRAFAGVLSAELAAEEAPSLAAEQRAALTAALEGQPDGRAVVRPVNGRGPGRGPGRRPGSRGAVLRLWLTSAAAVVLGVLTWKLATDGGAAVGDHALLPASEVARLDESASGAKLGKNERTLEAEGRGVRVSNRAARQAGEDTAAGGSAPARLEAEYKKRLSALGYGGVAFEMETEGGADQADAIAQDDLYVERLGEESGEELVLEMYDVRDLVSTPGHFRSKDYNLLPSGSADAGAAGDRFDDLSHDTLVPGDKLTFPTAEQWEAVEEEGPRSLAQGGGGGGSRIDSTSEAGQVGEGHRPPGGGGGSFYVQGARASAGLPVAAAEPTSSPAATVAEPKLLRELGYLDGSIVDAEADDDSYGLELRHRRSYRPSTGGESYAPIHENPFQPLTQDRYSALSTFGIDVDTASYSNARRFLNRNQAPPPDAVRLEEFINAFDYDLPAPTGEHPFSVSVDAATAPWAPRHRLVRIGLKGLEFDRGERPASNLVFLLDVSGSMKDQDKLPLLVASLKMLVAELDEADRVAIVTYASGTRLALPSTSGADKGAILAALDSLTANGSTNASDGIQNAYKVALENFVEGGTNRVLLATDGDFNVGITENGPLETFIADKARSGVFLTVLGFGTGNLKDSKAEILADRGNGNYAYIDNLNEAHKVLVREMSGTLVTIAKDVKLQVEFNPGRVAAYRLLGYENRALAPQDFRDDKKDAGEIGAGHSVTALYEIVPVGVESLPGAVELKYQAAPPEPEVVLDSPELLTVNLRYKLPDEDEAHEFAVPFVDGGAGFEAASEDFRFAAAVASFGMVLRHSAHRGDVDLSTIYEWAAHAQGEDPHGDRAEFLRLVRNAQGLPGY